MGAAGIRLRGCLSSAPEKVGPQVQSALVYLRPPPALLRGLRRGPKLTAPNGTTTTDDGAVSSVDRATLDRPRTARSPLLAAATVRKYWATQAASFVLATGHAARLPDDDDAARCGLSLRSELPPKRRTDSREANAPPLSERHAVLAQGRARR